MCIYVLDSEVTIMKQIENTRLQSQTQIHIIYMSRKLEVIMTTIERKEKKNKTKS